MISPEKRGLLTSKNIYQRYVKKKRILLYPLLIGIDRIKSHAVQLGGLAEKVVSPFSPPSLERY